MSAATAGIVCPGEPLRFAEEFRAGPGTYVRGQHVVAAVVGTARVVAAAEDATTVDPPWRWFVAARAARERGRRARASPSRRWGTRCSRASPASTLGCATRKSSP